MVIAAVMVMLSALACGADTATEAPAVDAQDISGTYDVTGTSLDGSAYSGEAVLTRTAGNSYDITWTFATQSQTGTGTFDGTTLNVDFEDVNGVTGLGTYTLQSDGSLSGTWTADGYEGEGTESLTPQ